MPEIHDTVLIQAKPEAVWEILVDPHYEPKLYPDILNIVAKPPGRAVVGQKRTTSGRAGKRVVNFYTQVTELIPLKRFALTGLRGGAFETFSQVVELSAVEGGTQASVTFFFKISEDYFGPDFDLMVLNELSARNHDLYLKNLKGLSELQLVS
jgi:Polyketide cyclase / dehydrase and lipid transport